jgi:hypothetical protein
MRRLASFILCLFVWAFAARAETPPACAGTNLLDRLNAQNPAAYAEVMAEAKAVLNHDAVFWKIEREGRASSYLLGTAHVTDDRITTLRPEIERALLDADAAAFELEEVASRERMALASLGLARYMVLPSGKTLWDFVPDDQESLIRNNPNLPPGAANGLFGYQPWVVAVSLSMPLCEVLRVKSGVMPLDMKLAVLAQEEGIAIHGLETLEEQLSILSGLPIDQQLDYLLAVAKNAALIPDQFETLVSLYQQRLVTAMIPLMLRLQPLNASEMKMLEYVERDLVAKRNHRMAERALPLLENGNVFVAVGALHLPGKEGVVELLRQAGYKLTPIN